MIDLRQGFTDTHRSRLLEYCLLEEADLLLRDVCPAEVLRQYGGFLTEYVFSEKVPVRSLPEDWSAIFKFFYHECGNWIAGCLELFSWDSIADDLARIPTEVMAPSGAHFSKQISNIPWTDDLLDQWASAWDSELVGKVRHQPRDPGLVLTHKETGLKILLCVDPGFVVRVVRYSVAQAAITAVDSSKDDNSQQTDLADLDGRQQQQQISSSNSNLRVQRGQICVQVKQEIKRVQYMARDLGKSIKEIRAELPDLRIWQMAESDELSKEDREMLLHPNQWATGYSNLLLSKYFKVQQITIRDYVTAYNQAFPPKGSRVN